MKRPHVFLILLVLVIQPTLAWSQTPSAGATAAPDHIALSWTGNPATTMTISWRTDTTVTNGIVEYQTGTATGPKAKQVKATSSDLTTDLGTVRVYTASLVSLSPKTKYAYRVGDGKQWSDSRSFTTADPKAGSVKFLVFGDSQSSASGTTPYSVWGKTIHNAYKANPDAKFFIMTGDLSDAGQNYAHWKGWFANAAGVIDSIPAMPVTGNHESYGSPTTGHPIFFTGQFALPQNGPASFSEQIYSYDYGPVHMVALDSQQDEQGYRDMFKQETAWMEKDLAASKAPWKVAYFHKGPYEIHVDRKNTGVKNTLAPILEKYHVDVVFNGHDHGIARTYPMKDGVMMQKPSQGTVYVIDGRSGTKAYKEVEKKPWNAFFYNPQEQPNYLVVEATATKLTIKTIKQDGTLIDSYFIDKKADICTDTK